MSPNCTKNWGSSLGQRPEKIFLDPILGENTYLWFCASVWKMVLGMMFFCPWYFVYLVKGNIVII